MGYATVSQRFYFELIFRYLKTLFLKSQKRIHYSYFQIKYHLCKL